MVHAQRNGRSHPQPENHPPAGGGHFGSARDHLPEIGAADNDFKRRNRMGGMELIAHHALEFYVKKEIDAHPDWQAMKNGQRNPKRLCWANPAVADAVANAILAKLDRGTVSSLSLSPNDGTDFCQCDKCKALDAGDFDPS